MGGLQLMGLLWEIVDILTLSRWSEKREQEELMLEHLLFCVICKSMLPRYCSYGLIYGEGLEFIRFDMHCEMEKEMGVNLKFTRNTEYENWTIRIPEFTRKKINYP